ncbi:MAG: AraC family transcriptional regulator [uncultured Sulfurovum sp.]|uniref:AraC family transcriptional regulator n=1 Tax=uncultured Sulfurovum sp. TaxID=269237 RepID=A0A6S6U3D2_9BACT|nr:MAG: AraC family transcriptional regulator [uncultured Sulfurovum sp.]
MKTWILSNNIDNPTQIALLHDNPTITPLADCQYVACVAEPEAKDMKSERLPKFQIAGGVYAKFNFEGIHGDMLKFIHWVHHEWMVKSEYETTTKPSYVIYHKNNFLEEDERFDVSFYVSITY